MVSAWCWCALSSGYPHWSWQLCDQPLVWLTPLSNRGRAGWWLHSCLWQEDGSERVVTTCPSQACRDPHVSSSFFPSKSFSARSPAVSWPTESTQPGWWKPTCRSILKATSWVSGRKDFTVGGVFFFLKHSLFFCLNSASAISRAQRVKLFSLTFASVIKSRSRLGGEKAGRNVKISLEACLVWLQSKQGGIFAEITITRHVREESGEPET